MVWAHLLLNKGDEIELKKSDVTFGLCGLFVVMRWRCRLAGPCAGIRAFSSNLWPTGPPTMTNRPALMSCISVACRGGHMLFQVTGSAVHQHCTRSLSALQLRCTEAGRLAPWQTGPRYCPGSTLSTHAHRRLLLSPAQPLPELSLPHQPSLPRMCHHKVRGPSVDVMQL